MIAISNQFDIMVMAKQCKRFSCLRARLPQIIQNLITELVERQLWNEESRYIASPHVVVASSTVLALCFSAHLYLAITHNLLSPPSGTAGEAGGRTKMKQKLIRVYLRRMINELQNAISEAESLMPESAARRMVKKHIVEHEGESVNEQGFIVSKAASIMGATYTLSMPMPCSIEDHYVEIANGQFLALEPLEEYLATFNDDLSELSE
jgi:hypothetical protein